MESDSQINVHFITVKSFDLHHLRHLSTLLKILSSSTSLIFNQLNPFCHLFHISNISTISRYHLSKSFKSVQSIAQQPSSHQLSLMTTSKDSISSDTAMEATISDQNLKPLEPFLLRRLPLELRRKIYHHYLFATRNPSPKSIYLRHITPGSRDRPSPLLRVNRQVRAEVLDLVQIWPFLLRVTDQGIQFGSLAETCFIAQQIPRDYGSIPHLVVEIWPPHPDRPTDVLDIWRHLRKFRAELQAIPPLQRISFRFDDNEIASWTHHGKALNLLDSYGADTILLEQGFNDVTYIIELFARVSAKYAWFYLPRGLEPGTTTENMRNWLWNVTAMMRGVIPIIEGTYSTEDKEEVEAQDFDDEHFEWRLQRDGALIARDKLDVMTRQGRSRLTRREWEYFIDVWSPKFERLSPKEFKGKLHYVYEDDPWDSA